MSEGPSRVPLLAAVVGLAGGAMARAQPADEGGPIVVGERDEWKAFELHSFHAAVGGEARWRRSEQKTDGQPDLTETERYLLGEIELGGEAYVGHRNLLDLVGRVSLGYDQTDTDSDFAGETGLDSDFRTLYDISGLILGEGPAPLTVYARQDESRLDREFAPTIDAQNSEYGAMLRIRSDVAPTWFHYFHRETDQTDPLGESDFFSVQDTFSMRSDVVLTDQQDLSLEYTYDSVEERISTFRENSFDRHDARLTHSVNFGSEERNNLRSMLRYYDESGLADLRRLRLDETLRLEHTDVFETRYDLVAEDVTRRDEDQRFYRGQAQATYRLFESLIATGSVGASRLEIDGFQSDELFTDVVLDYTKRVPYGRFDASVGAGYNTQDNSERGEPITVNDDRVTLTDTQPALISRRNIVGDTILVTDSAGIRIYVEGIDYTVEVFPSHVEIRRIIGGAIADGEVVLVDYVIGPEPASTIDTTNASFSTRYSLDEGLLSGLGVYVIYQWVDQSIDTVDPTLFVLEELHDLRYGVDYRIGGLTLLAERQEHDSNIFPYDTNRFEARYAIRLSPASALSASATHESTEYHDDGDTLDVDRANLRWYGRIGPDLDFNLDLTYRDERSRLSIDSTGFEQLLQLTWRKGKTTINGTLRNSMLDSDNTDTLSQEIGVALRRTF